MAEQDARRWRRAAVAGRQRKRSLRGRGGGSAQKKSGAGCFWDTHARAGTARAISEEADELV